MTHKPDSLVVRKGRRLFLAGSAGLVALPFLESLARPSPTQAWTPVAGRPKRLITFFNGHGLIMENYVPRAGFEQGAILQPVADAGLAAKMLVVTGINSKVQSGHGGAPSVLTCTPMVADMYGITHPTTPSVDHVIARHMQDGGAPRRFDVGVDDQSTNLSASSVSGDHSQMFWSGDNEHIPSIIHPHFALDRAFPMSEEPGMPTVDARLVRRRSVLDGALAQFDRLRGRVSATDRSRLDRHADHLRSIETSLTGMVGPTGPSCMRPTFESPTTHARAAEILIDTLALAMACNRADVGSFKAFDLEEAAWGHITHPDLAATFAGENYHGAWHRASDMRVDAARRAFTAINAWHGSLFARLLQRLDEVDEGEGTALDNTMVVWVSDFGHGGGHASDNLPITFAGNVGGATLGRHVNYATNPESPYGEATQPGNHNLCVTMQQAFGITSDQFGDYTNVAQPVENGPLSLS